MPLSEMAELRPLTTYAASKAAQEIVARQAFRADGLRVICTRSFNHSGVGHGDHFLVPSLVRSGLALRSADIPFSLGNLETVRDYLHVSDVASAYLSLLDQGQPGEVYNVCSGEGITVRELAEEVLDRVGVRAELAVDPARARAVDVPIQVGDNMKLRLATGWAPRKTRLDIIDDLIHAATH
jgi:GDP-4-dehydro-6-deoxy-D-mannose reductase